MHGVQANAKAMPMTGAAHSPSREGRTSKRCSPVTRVTTLSVPVPAWAQTPDGSAPSSMTAPRTMITAPLTWVRVISCASSTRPMLEAAAPSATKTTVKPATKSPMPRSTGRKAADGVAPSPPASNSAAERPETMET